MLTDPHGMSTEVLRAELEEAASAFEELGDEAALATVWTELAEIEWMPCRYDRAERAARRAIEHARRSGDERLLANALIISLAAPMLGTATPQEGIRGLDDLGADLSRSRQLEGVGLIVRAFYLAMQGDFDEARRLSEHAAGDRRWGSALRSDLAGQHEQLGEIERYAGDVAASERAFRRSYEIMDALGDEGHKSTSAAALAEAPLRPWALRGGRTVRGDRPARRGEGRPRLAGGRAVGARARPRRARRAGRSRALGA